MRSPTNQNVFYRTLQRVSASQLSVQESITDYIEHSQQRLKTQEFLKGTSKTQIKLRTILNFQKPERINSRRLQIQQAERVFAMKLCDGNRQELLKQMETLIHDTLKEEFKELAHLFATFTRELRYQVNDQMQDLQLNGKRIEVEALDEFQRLHRNVQRESASVLQEQGFLKIQLEQKDKEIQRLDNVVKDLIQKDKQLLYRTQLLNQSNSYKDQQIKNIQFENQSLKLKINYFEGKLEQQQKHTSLVQGKLMKMTGSIPNSPKEIERQRSLSSEESHLDDDLLKLNQMEINYENILQYRTQDTQVESDLISTEVKEQQTDLILVDTQFDVLNQNQIETAVKYNSFFQNLNGNQDQYNDEIPESNTNLDSLIEEAFEQQIDDSPNTLMVPQFSFTRRASSPMPNGREDSAMKKSLTLKKKENKVKKVLKFITFQKTQLQQKETDLGQTNDKLNQMFKKCNTLSVANCQLVDENQKLLDELLKLRDDLEKLKQQNEIPQDSVEVQKMNNFQGNNNNNSQSQQSQQQQQQQQQNRLLKRQKKEFHLGQRVAVSYDFQKNQSKLLIEKVKQKKMGKFQNFMPLKLVLKYITTMYQDKLNAHKENKFMRDQDMAAYIYNYYLQQFGYTKVTEQRFLILVLSITKNLKILRVNIFARFMNLLDDHTNFSLEEQQKYIEAWEYVSGLHNLGVAIKDNEAEQKCYIPYVRALNYLGWMQSFSQEESQKLKTDIEQLKEIDPKGLNKLGIIDFDLMMLRVLQLFRNNFEKTKTYVINAFAASDLDGNGMCNLDEWLLLNKYIESEKYDEDKLIDVFEEQADIVTDEEKNLSFDRFSLLCMEMDLFSDRQQCHFLQIRNNEDATLQFQELQKGWTHSYLQQTSEMDENSKWYQILEVLNEKITNNQQPYKPLLIAYKIFLNEYKL